jgi:hypothetical protein
MNYCPKCGTLNDDSARVCVSCGQALPGPTAASRVQVKTSGLAIAAFVLGILSIFALVVTGLPAIILGIIALAAIGRSGGRLTGRAFAVLGIVLPVFSIFFIALLMAILMPALSQARMQARNAVCQSNLKQWSLAWSLYADDNNGKFNSRPGAGRYWMDVIKDYAGRDETIWLCPVARKIANPEMAQGVDWWGKTFVAWGSIPSWGSSGGRTRTFCGSYGVNGYIFVPGMGSGLQPPARFWGTPNVKRGGEIPMFLDCYFWEGWVDSDDTPPQYSDWQDRSDTNAMNRYCLDRHRQRINAAFLDYSVRPVGLKELWTLNWYNGYDRAGSWTSVGGIRPNDWPEWMRKMKDY